MRRGLLGLMVFVSALLVMQLRRCAAVVTVEGDSMWPTFAPGDRVLVQRIGMERLRPGQVVVVEQPSDDRWATPPRGPVSRRHWVIKRVAAVPGDPTPEACRPAIAGSSGEQVPTGKLVLLGDNAAWSHDSRQIGYFPAERLLGVVVRRMARSQHAGWLPPGYGSDRFEPGPAQR